MADLVPFPFAPLIEQMLDGLERHGEIFHLPAKRFVRGDPEVDLSVGFHGRRASSPLGPAAGPQTQMAQNIVLSWLGGSRILELKTVQILDELHIPRPCIDVQTIGLNAEWSQELKLEESLDEYVKGAMLVEMLRSRPGGTGGGLRRDDLRHERRLRPLRHPPPPGHGVHALDDGRRRARRARSAARSPTASSTCATSTTRPGCPTPSR